MTEQTISQEALDDLFPITDEDMYRWIEGETLPPWKRLICWLAICYQADIDHAAQQGDHLEVYILARKVVEMVRRFKATGRKIPAGAWKE